MSDRDALIPADVSARAMELAAADDSPFAESFRRTWAELDGLRDLGSVSS